MMENHVNDTDSSLDFQKYYIAIPVVATIFVVGLLLDLIGLASVTSRIIHQEASKLEHFVFSVCAAIVGILLFNILPVLVYEVADDYVFGRVGCKMHVFLDLFFQYVMAGLQIAMAVQAVRHSGNHGNRDANWRTTCTICGSWFLGMIAVYGIFTHELVTLVPSNLRQCSIGHFSQTVQDSVAVMNWVILWAVPCLLALICYPIALYRAFKTKSDSTKLTSDVGGFPIYRLESCQPFMPVKHVIMVALTGAAYVLCMLPAQGAKVAHVFHPGASDYMSAEMLFYAKVAQYSLTIILPIIIICFTQDPSADNGTNEEVFI